MVVKPKNIDEYLAAVSDDKRAALERLRKIIRTAVPKAEECISYQLPAFRLDGKCFVWFGAAANHCAIYGVLGDHKDGELLESLEQVGLEVGYPGPMLRRCAR